MENIAFPLTIVVIFYKWYFIIMYSSIKGETWMKTSLKEIVDLAAIGGANRIAHNDILRLATTENIPPAHHDEVKNLFIGIDFQNDFLENGELAVPNSHQDLEHTIDFLYRNMKNITKIIVSLDTHSPEQIFHPAWWVDIEGNHPQPYTIISEEDILSGKWQAVSKQEESLEYVQQLEQLGRMKLCIWPYHCIEGTFGAALEGQFSNLIHFYSVARKAPLEKIVKGKDPLSEMYGIIKPEFNRNNEVNLELLQQLKNYDHIYIAGEAKSHCVLESLRQILEHYKEDRGLTSRIYLLEDCMSPIPGFEDTTEASLKEFESVYGIKRVNSVDIIL